MRFIAFVLIFSISLFQFASIYALGKWLVIKNNCNVLYPKEYRESAISMTHYQQWYARCTKFYNSYTNTLDQIFIDWDKAIETNKSQDWVKVYIWYQWIYDIMNEYWELLTNFSTRDVIMGDISYYMELIEKNRQEAKSKEYAF